MEGAHYIFWSTKGSGPGFTLNCPLYFLFVPVNCQTFSEARGWGHEHNTVCGYLYQIRAKNEFVSNCSRTKTGLFQINKGYLKYKLPLVSTYFKQKIW